MFSVAMGYRLRRFPRESNLDFSCGMLNTALPRSFYEEGDKPLLSLENRSNSVTNDNAAPLFKGREGTCSSFYNIGRIHTWPPTHILLFLWSATNSLTFSVCSRVRTPHPWGTSHRSYLSPIDSDAPSSSNRRESSCPRAPTKATSSANSTIAHVSPRLGRDTSGPRRGDRSQVAICGIPGEMPRTGGNVRSIRPIVRG